MPLTPEDYALIQKTMELDAGELLQISERGKQDGLLHWKVGRLLALRNTVDVFRRALLLAFDVQPE